jgi:hypothetical protein
MNIKRLIIIFLSFMMLSLHAQIKTVGRKPSNNTWSNGATTSALNLVIKINQSPENIKRLEHLKEVFAKEFQPKINKVFEKSGVVHYARFLIIENKYLLILTEFDGDRRFYTEVFRAELLHIFKAVFSLSENPPTEEQLFNGDKFFDFVSKDNISGLGSDLKTDEERGNTKDAGYFFNAYPGVSVQQIQDAFSISF